MQIDLISLRDKFQDELDNAEVGNDTHQAYLGGKVDLLNDLIALGFKVGA